MDKAKFLKRLEAIDNMALDTIERHDRLLALILEYLKVV